MNYKLKISIVSAAILIVTVLLAVYAEQISECVTGVAEFAAELMIYPKGVYRLLAQ